MAMIEQYLCFKAGCERGISMRHLCLFDSGAQAMENVKAHFSPTGAHGRLPVAAEIRLAPRFYVGHIIQTRIGRNGFRSAWRLRF
jgi:hypothetical protein